MRSFSAIQMLAMERINIDLDARNDPTAYRLREAIKICKTEADIMEVLLQGCKAYKDTLDVVKTVKAREMDLRGEPIKFIVSEDQLSSKPSEIK